ncbi:MAG: TAXI family TRAP transporter solute-binding subunit [Magnetococcus sp. XQGC-1]
MSKWPVWAVVGLLLTACSSPEEKKPLLVTLGTNGQVGSYVAVGKSLCDIVGEPANCKLVSAGGATQNMENLQAGKTALAIVRADAMQRAWSGQAPFKEKLNKFRVLFALQEEAVTLVAPEKAEITFFQRIRGKRLNGGLEGSDDARLVAELSESCKEVLGDVSLGRLGPTELAHAMQSRAVDGYFSVMSHPDFALSRSMLAAPLEIVPIGGECVDSLIRSRPHFEATSVPGKVYRGADLDIPTVGVRYWVVAHADVNPDVTYRVVLKVFENLDKFRQSNPYLYRLSPRRMVKSINIPYHAGALKYYQKKGWFKSGK